jgi:UDP-3-O-[3-hydroxymyristoyl] glucosamine N-acyltransferase
MSKKVVIIGGEGNGGVIAACIEDNRTRFGDLEWEVAGFVNDYEQEVCGYHVIGTLKDIPVLLQNPDYYFMWGIHLVARNVLTEKMFREAAIPRERFATIVHKTAFIGQGATIEPGVMVMSNSYVGPGARIGLCSLIMANCSIGHNINIDELCHCSVGSIMTGYSKLSFCSDLAVGATLLAFRVVGKYAMAAAGSLIAHDIPDYEIHAGIPARFLKKTRMD